MNKLYLQDRSFFRNGLFRKEANTATQSLTIDEDLQTVICSQD
ncbi:MAG: hypothetical protein ACXV8U_22080 [Methylobacter sp.]